MNEVIERTEDTTLRQPSVDSFSVFKDAVNAQIQKMLARPLFVVDVERDELWNTYLESFPPGTNPIYRERTEHDCSCCRHFIRDMGGVVALVDDEIKTIWDVDLPEGSRYAPVAAALANRVATHRIKDIFLHDSRNVGTDHNNEMIDGVVHTWQHFHCLLPNQLVVKRKDIATLKGRAREDKQVLKRSLTEISLESADIVSELIAQGSLYRGEEHAHIVQKFKEEKRAFDGCGYDKEAYCWLRSRVLGSTGRFRNTVIGTLLSDLSNGVDLEDAVRMFESKVAPASYKRPKALVTKRMVENAKAKIVELGLEDSLPRRHAVIDDVDVNDVLFVDRSVRTGMDVFDEIAAEHVNPNKLNKVQEITIDKFMTDVLPLSTGLELLFENRLEKNLMTLTSPVNTSAPPLFNWDSGFSWSYNGEVADSIRDRVAKAGGSVTGALRCSLSWCNTDDLDLHLKGPKRMCIYYGNKRHPSGGQLDVDMNVDNPVRDAVENITWARKRDIPEGAYKLIVNNYRKRERKDVGFEVEIEFEGEIHTFNYPREVTGNVTVAEFSYSKKDGVRITKSLPSSTSSREVWNLNTSQWQQVNFAMLSPNHWGDKAVGNKHWFFILDQCRNPDSVRGFYNEFLKPELTEHRKVFEVLGSKMRAGYSDDQLSGLGFSSTQTNHVFCRVKGAFDRVVKIIF